MSRSYNNTLVLHEVSVAIEQFLIAPYPQVFSPARIDLANPPAGYVHLGGVVEDTPSLSISREKYQIITGIPRVPQYQAIIGVNGKLEFSLWSNSYHKVQYALGNLWYSYNSVTTTSVTTLTTIASGEVFTQYLGTKNINEFALLGVADFINGAQVIHELGRCSPADDWQESFKPDAAGQVPMSFDLLGYETTLGSCTELIVGKRHYISSAGVTCVS